LDMGRATAECDVAVLGGGHGATAEMLLAGKPVLELPVALEQRMTAEAVERLGAGLRAATDDVESVRSSLVRLLGDDGYARMARRFAGRYAAFDPRVQRRATPPAPDTQQPRRPRTSRTYFAVNS